MDYLEVKIELAEGKKARRAEWKKGVYIETVDGHLTMNGQMWYCLDADANSKTWEIFEDKKPVKMTVIHTEDVKPEIKEVKEEEEMPEAPAEEPTEAMPEEEMSAPVSTPKKTIESIVKETFFSEMEKLKELDILKIRFIIKAKPGVYGSNAGNFTAKNVKSKSFLNEETEYFDTSESVKLLYEE